MVGFTALIRGYLFIYFLFSDLDLLVQDIWFFKIKNNNLVCWFISHFAVIIRLRVFELLPFCVEMLPYIG